MSEFKAGDRVAHRDYGDAEVTYGPFNGYEYLVRVASGSEVIGTASSLIPRPAFQEGSMALWCGREVSVMSDRLTDDSGVAHHVVKLDGRYGFASETSLSPVPSPAPLAVGDKIRILEDGHDGATVRTGEVLRVSSPRESDREFGALQAHESDDSMPWVFRYGTEGTGWERVTADTETVNGVTYVMGARYRDRDGDVWKFARVGSDVRGATVECVPDDECMTLASAIRAFGPLTRVGD